jgi:multimeric flavodoxin WrbA
MKVLLVNGSPHENGCTNRALQEIATSLKADGIESKIFWIGNKPISGCIGCGSCRTTGECAFKDIVNDFVKIAKNYDGFVFGSPVHFASASGAVTSFLDRVFYSGLRGITFRLKPAAIVVSARRAGTTATFDQLNKYLLISEMIVVGSQYWNNIHGNTVEEAEQDLEGLQTMRVLAHNMSYILKLQELGNSKGIKLPEKEDKKMTTNFISKK